MHVTIGMGGAELNPMPLFSNHYISAFDYDYLDSMINRFEDLVKNESEHTTWWESVISKQLSEDYKKTHQYVQM